MTIETPSPLSSIPPAPGGEERYRLLFDTIESGFCVVEVNLHAEGGRIDYRVIEANSAFYSQTGFPEAIFGHWLRAAAPDLEEHWFETYGRVARTGRPERFEQGSDLLKRWFDVYAFPAGAEGQVAILFTDISARRNAEIALQESEARFRNMADHAPVMTWVTDATGHCTYLNRAWYEFTGQSPEEARGFGWLEATHPDDRAGAERAFRQANSDKEAFRIEYRLRREDGSYRWAIDAAAPRFAPDGDFLGFVGSVIDIDERRESEDALRDSEARFRLMANSVPQIVWITDGDGRVQFFNQQWSDYIGVPYEAANAPEVAADHVHPDDVNATVKAFEAARQTGTTFIVEHRVRARSGEYRWFLVRGEPHTDPATGRIARWFGASVDIHDRKLAEAEHRRQAEELSAIYAAAPVGLCVLDRNLRFVRINERLAEMNGVAVDDHIGRTVSEVLPDLGDEAIGLLRQVLGGEPLIGVEITTTTAARPGMVRSWRENFLPLRDGSGNVTGITISAEEITEEKAVADALKASEARLREINADLEAEVLERTRERGLIWQHSLDLLSVVDTATGRFDACNPAWAAALGWSTSEIEGHPFAEFLHPDDVATSADAFERLQAGETVQHFENRYRAKDGGERWLSWTVVPEGGKLYSVTRDITAEKERAVELELTQEALRHSQKMEAMGQLTGGVAHDFNNLLAPIIASLDMLQRRGIGGEREQRMISVSLQSAERAKTVVQRLLAFARRQPLQATAVDVGNLITGMADLIGGTLGPQIRVVVDFSSDLPPAKADPNQLEMALLNLSVNARDAMPNGGTLRISASRERVGLGHLSKLPANTYIRLSVADTGDGMDDATLKRAVEPFFSTKGIGKGTGLGLSMVHGLALQLGGALTIQSHLGLGTNIELWLPLSTSVAAGQTATIDMTERAQVAGTVLLVDDEEFVRISTADMLADLGYEVVEAMSAEDALQLLRGGLAPDLLVTDHLMPGMNGTDLARVVRAEHPRTRVLLISGYAENEGVEPGLPRLTKPFRKAELADSLIKLTIPH